MKRLSILSITLILVLFVNNTPTVARFHMQSTQSQIDGIRADQATEPLDVQSGDNNKVERSNPNDTQDLSHGKSTNNPKPPMFSAIQSSESGGWHFECIECTKQFQGAVGRNLQLDSDGHPHIVYGGDHLYYAWHDGLEWHYETVDNALGVGGAAALALDAAGHPHISYASTTEGLKYAYWTGSTWQIQIVTSDGGGGTSIALDATGHPHIAYEFGRTLRYAYWTGSTWSVQVIDYLGDYGRVTAIALDAANRPHILYVTLTDDGLSNDYVKYASWTGSTWEIQLFGNGDDSGGYPTSMALDAAGLPHISLEDWSCDYCLKYAHWTGNTWIVQTVDGDAHSSFGPSIALDASGVPHISYFSSNGGLKHAYWSGSIWTIQPIDTVDGYGTSIALDALQRPHISYRTYQNVGTEDELKYAQWTGSQWDIEFVDREVSPGGDASLAVDAAGHAHISYARDGLQYTHWNGSEWITQRIDAAGDSSSLALDALGHPHISYIDGGIKYAYWIGSLWVTQTVASAGDMFGMFGTDLALSTDGTPHIIYYDFADDYLKYAHWTGSNWNIQSVEKSIDDLGNWPGIHSFSLALDSMGYPHITYLTHTGNLRYARWTGAVWDIQTVATYINNGRTSLALDVANRPHLCFQNSTYPNGGLKYAHWTGSAWNIQTLDNAYNAGSDCSLALDVAGNPHISYLGRYFGGMKYARWMNDTWAIQMVDNLGTGDGNSSDLALDTAGNPHLTYFNTGDDDIYYARLLSPLAIDQVATPRDGLSISDTLTVTLTLFGPGVNARLWDPLPANVEYIPGSVTAPAVYSSTAKAIVWQGTLPTETVQIIQFRITPSATIADGQSLSPVIINTAWLLDTEYNRTVSAITIVNGWYQYLPLVRR